MANENESQLNIPVHVAIIPDGNRRWAIERGLPTLEGHRQGALNFEKLVDTAHEMGIKAVTGWFFSTENWKRTENENKYLFNLARELAKQYREKVLKENIRFFHLGRKDRIPTDVIDMLLDLEEKSKHKTEFMLGVAMDYGGHDELLRTINKLVQQGIEVNSENIEKNLDTKEMPMPDFIIRPGGEQRLSGFMAWQSEYAEFYFPKMYFPDFTPEEFKKAIEEFGKRNRRFGGDNKK